MKLKFKSVEIVNNDTCYSEHPNIANFVCHQGSLCYSHQSLVQLTHLCSVGIYVGTYMSPTLIVSNYHRDTGGTTTIDRCIEPGWSILCSSADEWQEAIETLKNQKLNPEKQLARILEQYLPDIEEIISERVSTYVNIYFCVLKYSHNVLQYD